MNDKFRARDEYGIGVAIEAQVRNLQMISRGTGRTTAMIGALQPGDLVVCARHDEATDTKHLIRELRPELGEEVSVYVLDPTRPDDAQYPRGMRGRVLLSHLLVELFYETAVEQIGTGLNRLRMMVGGPQEKPVARTIMADRADMVWRR